MLDLPQQFILLDTEYTAWEGSQARKWSGPNEHKEIVQIGAIRVDNATLTEKNGLKIFITPTLNPILSEYFINLTGITQNEIDQRGIPYAHALEEFKDWCGGIPIYSFGHDGAIMQENCVLLNIPFPFSITQFNDIREFFKGHGISADAYYSSTIPEAFGLKAARVGHDALNDVRTILDGLCALQNTIPKKNN